MGKFDTNKVDYRDLNDLQVKRYADRKDEYTGRTESSGHDPSPDAIGGYYGIYWWEVYKTASGELYRVQCYDGVYKSKEAYYIADGHTDFCACTLAGPGTDVDYCTCMTEEQLGLLVKSWD